MSFITVKNGGDCFRDGKGEVLTVAVRNANALALMHNVKHNVKELARSFFGSLSYNVGRRTVTVHFPDIKDEKTGKFPPVMLNLSEINGKAVSFHLKELTGNRKAPSHPQYKNGGKAGSSASPVASSPNPWQASLAGKTKMDLAAKLISMLQQPEQHRRGSVVKKTYASSLQQAKKQSEDDTLLREALEVFRHEGTPGFNSNFQPREESPVLYKDLSHAQKEVYNKFVPICPADGLHGRSMEHVLVKLIVTHKSDLEALNADIMKWMDSELELEPWVCPAPACPAPASASTQKKPTSGGPATHAQAMMHLKGVFQRAAEKGDDVSLAQVAEIMRLLDNPVQRQAIQYKINKWSRVNTSACGENLCWLVAPIQGLTVKMLSQTALIAYRKTFQSLCKWLTDSFDEQSICNMCFERNVHGKPTGSQAASVDASDLFQTLKRRVDYRSEMGNELELLLLSTFISAEIHVHSLAEAGDSHAGEPPSDVQIVAIAGKKEAVTVITPMGMPRGVVGRVVHVHLDLFSRHYMTIRGVQGSLVPTQDVPSPDFLLNQAKTYFENLAQKYSPESLASELSPSALDEASYLPIRKRELKKAPPRFIPLDLEEGEAPTVSRIDRRVDSLEQKLDELLQFLKKPQPQGPSAFVDMSSDDPGLIAAKQRVVDANAQLAALQRRLVEEEAVAAVSAAAAASAIAATAAAVSDVLAADVEPSSSSDDSSKVDLTGGAEEGLDDASITARLDSALLLAESLLKSASCNDLAAEWFFDNAGLVGNESGSVRDTAVLAALEKVRPTLRKIVGASVRSGQRTRKASVQFSRLLSYVNGSVEIGAAGAALRSDDKRSPTDSKEQRFTLDQYTPLLEALFPPGKFVLDKATLTKGGHLDDAAATAILSVLPRRQ